MDTQYLIISVTLISGGFWGGQGTMAPFSDIKKGHYHEKRVNLKKKGGKKYDLASP